MIQVIRKVTIDLFSNTFRNIASVPIEIDLFRKPLIYAKLAFESIRRNRTNLNVISLRLKLVDERNSFVAIAKSGVQNQILSAINRSRSQLLGPGAGIGMGIVRPGVGVIAAERFHFGMKIPKRIGIYNHRVSSEFDFSRSCQAAFTRSGLSGKDDDAWPLLGCRG